MAEPLWRGRTIKVSPESRYSWLDGGWLSVPSGTEVAVVPWPLPHDHDAMLDHLIDEWGHLGVVMQMLRALTDDQASRLLDAARARVELTPEAFSGQATEEETDG